jgi:hypothetical protein
MKKENSYNFLENAPGRTQSIFNKAPSPFSLNRLLVLYTHSSILFMWRICVRTNYMLNLLVRTSKFCTFTMSIIVELKDSMYNILVTVLFAFLSLFQWNFEFLKGQCADGEQLEKKKSGVCVWRCWLIHNLILNISSFMNSVITVDIYCRHIMHTHLYVVLQENNWWKIFFILSWWDLNVERMYCNIHTSIQVEIIRNQRFFSTHNKYHTLTHSLNSIFFFFFIFH